MKRKIIVISMLFIFSLCGHLNAQEIQMSDTLYNSIVNETVLPYCKALRDGDVSSIKQYLSEDMYEKNRVLLEQNTEYPEFLRKYYQGARFKVVKAEEVDDNIIVNVEFEYPDGRLNYGKLRLGKDNQEVYGSDSWKIIEFSM
jgi:hypothetical protein